MTHRDVESATTTTQFGMPQGSILGPYCFVLYTADVVHLVQQHGFNVHQYADDTQIYSCCHPDNSASLCQNFNRQLDVAYIDIKSAFDSVDRVALWKAL